MPDESTIPSGLCQCGCGEKTRVSDQNHARFGWVKGDPMKYRRGHNRRGAMKWVAEDRGHETPCHVWLLYRNADGYGVTYRHGRLVLAHRAAWQDRHGRVPTGLELDHLCGQRDCVNPDHLEAVTHTENVRRGKLTKLTAASVRDIRERYAVGGVRQVDLAKEYGVTQTTISRIILGKGWRA